MPDIVLQCCDLVVGYAGRGLLPPIHLTVRAGEFWAVLGRNGSGKSTAFRTILGLLPPVSGQVRPADDLQLAYVAQRMSFDDLYPVTVREVVDMGRMRGGGFLRWRRPRGPVDAALQRVGAGNLADRTFRSLSEGQKQRVLLARMVASGAKLAVLDEPTAAMDAVAEREAMDLIDELRREHEMAVMVVSHQLADVRRRADQALFLDPDAPQVVVGPPQVVFGDEAFRARYGTEEVERAEAALPGRGER